MKPGNPARRAARKISYANVVATMALFIALGGISWAAATAPKNSVASKSIKKNAVTNAKIKNNAVTGNKIKSNSIVSSDVKNDSLTGDDINESTLGPVPSAGTANDSFNFVKVVQSSNTGANENAARAAATEIPLVSNGAVSVYAKCFVNTTDNVTHFEVLAKTSADGAAFAGYSTSDSAYSDPPLNVGTPEDSRQLTDDETDGPNSVDDDYASNVSILGPDGKGIYLSVENYARFGNPTGPPGFLPNTNSCAFHVFGSLTK